MDVVHAKEHFLVVLERYGRVYETLRHKAETCDAGMSERHWSRRDLSGAGLIDAFEAYVALRRTDSPDASAWFATEIERLERTLREIESALDTE